MKKRVALQCPLVKLFHIAQNTLAKLCIKEPPVVLWPPPCTHWLVPQHPPSCSVAGKWQVEERQRKMNQCTFGRCSVPQTFILSNKASTQSLLVVHFDRVQHFYFSFLCVALCVGMKQEITQHTTLSKYWFFSPSLPGTPVVLWCLVLWMAM